MPATPDRWRAPAALAAAAFAAIAVGALASQAFAPLIATAAILVLSVAVAARPRDSVFALALASPFYDLVVIRLEGIADVRILEILWLVAGVSLLSRVRSGTENRLKTPPRFFTAGLVAITGWFVVTALASGGGIRPFVEASQTAYLCMVAYIVASVLGASDAKEVMSWIRPWAFVMSAVLLVSLTIYVLGVDPVVRTVVTLPQMQVTFASNSLIVQNAGAMNVDIARLGVLNLGPVGTAAMLVSILAVAFAFTLTSIPAKRLTPSYLLLFSGGVVLLLTYSRAGWVLAIAAAGLVILGSNHERATIAIAALTLAVAIVAGLPSVAPRIEEFTDTGEGSYQAHARMWVTALHMVREKPVLGWGPGMYAENANRLSIGTWMAQDISADQPHNWLLEITAETGVPGGALAVVFIGAIMATGWRRTRGAPLPAFAVWIATGTYVVMNLTLNAFRTEMMWVWFGAVVAMSLWYAPAKPEELPCAS